MRTILARDGLHYLRDDWAEEQDFTVGFLSLSSNVRILDGHIILSLANGSAKYVITGVKFATDVIVGRLVSSSLLYRVDKNGERIIE